MFGFVEDCFAKKPVEDEASALEAEPEEEIVVDAPAAADESPRPAIQVAFAHGDTFDVVRRSADARQRTAAARQDRRRGDRGTIRRGDTPEARRSHRGRRRHETSLPERVDPQL
jgi:hypothetical protein